MAMTSRMQAELETVAALGFMTWASVKPESALSAARANASEGAEASAQGAPSDARTSACASDAAALGTTAFEATAAPLGTPACEPAAATAPPVAAAFFLSRTNTRMSTMAHAARRAVVQNDAW